MSRIEQPTTPPLPTARQRITPRALLEVKRLSDPQIHPDGQHVAFVVAEADFDESRFVSHLWLTYWDDPRRETEEPEEATEPSLGEESEQNAAEAEDWTRQLTYSVEGEHYPRWSPDGRYLAFLSARPDPTASSEEAEEDDPTEQVWLLPIEGGEARKLTAAKEGVMTFEWAPDSQSILYLAPEPRPRPIESVRKQERENRKIDPIVEHQELLRRQIWRIGIDDDKPKPIYTGDVGTDDFALSPDGETLCFTTNYTGDDNDYHVSDLYVRRLSDGLTYKLAQRPGGKYHLRWSPDSRQIAFLSWFDPAISFSRETIYLADLPSEPPASPAYGPEVPGATGCRTLTDLDTDLIAIEWSRHDGSLYAIAATGTGSALYAFTPETVRLDLGEPAERRDLAVAPESAAQVFVQESATSLPELYLRDSEGQVHPLTKLNAEFTDTYRLPRTEVVRWKSSDGLEIEGVLTYPLDDAEGARVPLIVQVHGGPKGRATATLRNYSMAPVWSAEGYAVLQPNFRGSEGYGHAFAIANRRDIGGGDFADIMAGVDWTVEQGIADPDRLGIMGGSYGGYMTNWAIGHTDRFRAAISMFGIFHLQTDYSNSELSRWDNDYLGAYYWEDPEIYRRLSPGSYIARIKTPTLILHGDEDDNTFISNSKELYQALRHRGVTTQFVHYPREGHGLREPNHKLDEIRRCLAWMDRYTRHGGQNPGLYRLHDRIPEEEGRFELCVTQAELASFLGQAAPRTEGATETTGLLEVAFTLHNRDTRQSVEPITLALADIRLETEDGAATFRPVGVPLDGPGGKVLVEGENLRIAQRPHPETGQLAFGCAVVFRVPKAGGNGRLHIATFPPVAVIWAADGKESEETENETPKV